MPPTPQQFQQAQAVQNAAARDASAQVRLVAGPGTGKSFTIEERMCWLLGNNVAPERLFAISFTNASAQDLKERILQACQRAGVDGSRVSVTTMHSLALRMLRTAGLLKRFPTAPVVLDQWEIREILDSEYCKENGTGLKRCQNIRRDHEANWNTGTFNPPNYIPPDPPVSPDERATFEGFLQRFTQVYSCIPPGAIVRECVDQIRAGLVSPLKLVPIGHLIVDEYQDLNPIDLEYVDSIIQAGAITFVAGDDDQSIYSFRYALPRGIQTFPEKYSNCGIHRLDQCFRCATEILAAANALIAAHPSANRIPKNIRSIYAESQPPVAGTMLRWTFQNGAEEARAIANSCSSLIDAGMSPSDIMILLSDRNVQLSTIEKALTAASVAYEIKGEQEHLSSDQGRLLYALLRVVRNADDYIAHRTLLALLPNVGIGTCVTIKGATVANNLNFKDLFTQPLPNGVFSAQQASAIGRVAAVAAQLTQISADQELGACLQQIVQVASEFGQGLADNISTFLGQFPENLTLDELRELITANSDERRTRILTGAYQRAGLDLPADQVPPRKVRVMTMHGAKGLSARAVFIPGLEEEVFPGPRRRPYAGLVEEAARLLYVSMTRARAACILSFVNHRVIHGKLTAHTASRFNKSTGGAFANQNVGLTNALAARVVADCAML